MDTPQDENEINSLEDQGTVVEPSATSNNTGNDMDSRGNPSVSPSPVVTYKQPFGNRIRNILSRINIYLLLFIFIMVIAVMVLFVSVQRSRKESATDPTAVQVLTPDALKQLNESEAKVGDPKQTLNIESNAVFTGKVLIRDSLDVAGAIKVGGSLTLPGITVSGTSLFDTIQANNLSIAGNTTIQGQLNVQRGLTVAGGASFNGALSAPHLTINTLQLNGDLQINRHVDAGGNTPGKTDGSAVGVGGTASVSGTDTAGTVTVNTGGNPPAGCFITITFAQRFNGTPHIVVTPVGSGAAGLSYYITRNTANFSICTTNSAPAGTSFSFDYIAID